MGGNSKRRIAGFAIASLVIAGVVGVTSLSVSGQTPSPPPTVPYATLTINITDRAGSVTLELLDGKTYNQSILTTQPCATLALGPITDGTDTYPGTLLDFTPIAGSGASVQIPGDGIGVESGQNCGTPAGLLGPGEKLQMSLGTFAAYDTNEDTVGNEVTVGSASLEIGRSRPADPKDLKVSFDSGTTESTFPVAVGVSTVQVGEFTSSITIGSTANQNSRGLSLRGQTSFALVAPIPYAEAVFCSDDPVPAEDVAETGPAAQDATFTRGDNNAAGGGVTQEGCDDIGVTLQIDEDGVFLDKGTVGIFTGEPQDVNATLEITWTPLDPESATLAADLDREINFFPEAPVADPGNVFVPVQWCLSSALEGTTLTAVHPQFVGPSNHPFAGDEVPWCLVSNEETLTDGGIVQVQLYHGKGDPRMR